MRRWSDGYVYHMLGLLERGEERSLGFEVLWFVMRRASIYLFGIYLCSAVLAVTEREARGEERGLVSRKQE